MDNNIKVKCKFKCTEIIHREHYSNVKFEVVTNGSEENEKYFKYTPAGEISLDILKEEVANYFIPGEEYYLDISLAGNNNG